MNELFVFICNIKFYRFVVCVTGAKKYCLLVNKEKVNSWRISFTAVDNWKSFLIKYLIKKSLVNFFSAFAIN